MTQKYYAHSLEGKPPSELQPLEVHLKIVAEMVAEFARPFKDEAWARLAGLWHDIGKYSKDSQFKLMVENGFEDHIKTKPGRVIYSQA